MTTVEDSMPTNTPVTDNDGNKRYRSNDESLANSNVTRPAPLDAERAPDTGKPKERGAKDDSSSGQSR